MAASARDAHAATSVPPSQLTSSQLQQYILSGKSLSANPDAAGAMVTPFTTSPNILVIIVDELFVATTKYFNNLIGTGSQQALFQQFTPTITWLSENSINFQHYFVASTECTPSRASMLTGLYSHQTFMYNTQTGKTPRYDLDTRFPNWGNTIQNLVSQYSGNVGQTPYRGNTTFIGKWHLSNFTGEATQPYAQYGFAHSWQSPVLPAPPFPVWYASPNGAANEGEQPMGGGVDSALNQYYASDSDIIADFQAWANSAPPSPWLTVVSLVNPHDINFYPNALLGNGWMNYSPSWAPTITPGMGQGYTAFPFATEDISQLNPQVKPKCQLDFLAVVNGLNGKVGTVAGSSWTNFMNFYLAIMASADLNVSTVVSYAIPNQSDSSKDLANTVVIFTSDHGDYAGNHGLHQKGGAAYEEVLRVPLYVHFPGMRYSSQAPAPGLNRYQMCSSVDLFSLIMGLGSDGANWRTPTSPHCLCPDQQTRQSLYLYIFQAGAAETRVMPQGSALQNQPYIVFTTNEDQGTANNADPIHINCFRTKQAGPQAPLGPPSPILQSGAKMATYDQWVLGVPGAINQSTKTQFEFYDFTDNQAQYGNAPNFNEQGNDISLIGTGPAGPITTLFGNLKSSLGTYVNNGTTQVATGICQSELALPLLGNGVNTSGQFDSTIVLSRDVQPAALTAYFNFENS